MTWRVCVWGQALWKGFPVIAAGAGGRILKVTCGMGFCLGFWQAGWGEFKGVPGEGSRASLSNVAEVPYLQRRLLRTVRHWGGRVQGVGGKPVLSWQLPFAGQSPQAALLVR